MTASPFDAPSFMAALGHAADWRLVLIYDAARSTGLLDVLPATIEEAAGRAALQPVATRAVLEALTAGGITTMDEQGVVALGEHAPDADVAVQLHQHASAIRRWSSSIEPRLRGEEIARRGVFQLKEWLASMAVNASKQADRVAEAALSRVTVGEGPLRALDLGGGHGRYAAALAARGATVIMQDRADVLEVVEREGWLAGTGVQTVAGDFHESLPDGPFDIVLAVGVMHTMAPHRAESLLARVAERMRPSGVLVIRTMLRNHGPASALFAIQMLVAGTGGDTHRLEDYQQWLSSAGLTAPTEVALDNGTMLISTKP